MRRHLLWCFGFIVLSACQWSYNFTESHYTQQLLTRAWQKQGIHLRELKCDMMELTRDFRCRFALSPTEWAQIQKKLEFKASSLRDARHRYLYQRYRDNCEQVENFQAQTGAQYFEVVERRSLSDFEFFSLYYSPDRQEACLQSAQRLTQGPT